MLSVLKNVKLICFTARRTIAHVYAVSVRLSVARVYCIEITEHIIKQLALYCSVGTSYMEYGSVIASVK